MLPRINQDNSSGVTTPAKHGVVKSQAKIKCAALYQLKMKEPVSSYLYLIIRYRKKDQLRFRQIYL